MKIRQKLTKKRKLKDNGFRIWQTFCYSSALSGLVSWKHSQSKPMNIYRSLLFTPNIISLTLSWCQNKAHYNKLVSLKETRPHADCRAHRSSHLHPLRRPSLPGASAVVAPLPSVPPWRISVVICRCSEKSQTGNVLSPEICRPFQNSKCHRQ